MFKIDDRLHLSLPMEAKDADVAEFAMLFKAKSSHDRLIDLPVSIFQGTSQKNFRSREQVVLAVVSM